MVLSIIVSYTEYIFIFTFESMSSSNTKPILDARQLDWERRYVSWKPIMTVIATLDQLSNADDMWAHTRGDKNVSPSTTDKVRI